MDRAFLESGSAPAAARAAAESGADIIQYRDKISSARDFLSVVLAIKDALRGSSVPLIVNDRLDIALAAQVDGVHLGQDDLPASAARRLGGKDIIIGVSASTPEEARAAEKDGADYLGAGAFFPTATKTDIRPIERLVFADIVRSVRLPVLAIGGITAGNLSEAISAGAAGVAVISAARAGGSVSRAVGALREALDKR
jgi:thiamine-phosphate pyrophosphorylase